MLLAALAACPVCVGVSGSPALDPLRQVLASAYRDAGACVPCEDSALSTAAARIAGGEWAQLPDPLVWEHLVQEAGAGDPFPRALVIVGSGMDQLASQLAAQADLDGTDTVVGLGVAERPSGVRGVIFRANRMVSVSAPTQRSLVGATISLQGRFLSRLSEPALYVEAPDGTVTQIRVKREGDSFRGAFVPQVEGRYLVEVMAHGPHGPEVEYLRPLTVGNPPRDLAPRSVALGADDAAAVLDAVNAERQRQGAPALSPDPRLDRIAQSYAEEMRSGGFFGHISPKSGDLPARLKRAAYPFARAGENLAQGPNALTAHALTADSPAHRKALIDGRYNRCGIGISRALYGDGRSDVLLVEVFALEQQR